MIDLRMDSMWEWNTGRCTDVPQLPNRNKELTKNRRRATL